MSTEVILPDSRLSSNIGSKMWDWQNPDGTVVRIECVPVFCANCAKKGPFVPKENTSFAFYLCQKCADKYGEIAGTMMVPDNIFFQKLHDEMIEHYGRDLTPIELFNLAEQGWGPLAPLVNESPYKVRT